ncbi:uncharacterized protein LOC126664485 [Mercurialis annua]|uniref:uncharacterized protein LOC126664485 n=1 Tax=Mercurialis annua TaxID=3986 RepID=UPI002160DF19|nr:uncharacterized protein LOC126664485 [Mercurialis annua]
MGAEEERLTKEQPRSNAVTEAQFLSWKRRKDADASARKAEVARKRAQDIAAGTLQMNGRELFLHDPSLFDNSLY